MIKAKSLLAIMPHPDDESLGFGGTLAKYGSDRSISTHLITATRGQKGSLGDPKLKVARASLPKVREQELKCAAKTLKVDKLKILDYVDGELHAVEEKIGITDMVRLIRKIKPQVVITFGPDGGYGHPDHIVLSHWVTMAVKHARMVKKLYYLANDKTYADAYNREFGTINLEGKKLTVPHHPKKYINAVIDAGEFVDVRFNASRCYTTQLKDVKKFEKLRQIGIKGKVTHDYYHLAFSRGEYQKKETDLFAGI